MTTVAGVLGFAVLFALFGLLRPRRKCTSDCGACSASCQKMESSDEASR